mmetsp:Transcript_15833/g.23488  ORF Transcript_15833/g.23488 Transcript_15833/m.23488 type:complete len:100 (+) Transcript_15833:56-355(+)
MPGLASGMAARTTAGTTMYDALAASTASIRVSPSDKPAQCARPMVISALTMGTTKAKPTKKGSMPFISRNRRATSKPISSRKKASRPLKMSPVKGFMTS